MAEWSNAPVLKTGEPQGSGGSNPSPSATKNIDMDFYVYVLQSEKTRSWYIGSTEDLEKRLKYHNGGKVPSTKPKRPWKMVYSESFATRTEAQTREKYLKSGWGRRWLKRNVPDLAT